MKKLMKTSHVPYNNKNDDNKKKYESNTNYKFQKHNDKNNDEDDNKSDKKDASKKTNEELPPCGLHRRNPRVYKA